MVKEISSQTGLIMLGSHIPTALVMGCRWPKNDQVQHWALFDPTETVNFSHSFQSPMRRQCEGDASAMFTMRW